MSQLENFRNSDPVSYSHTYYPTRRILHDRTDLKRSARSGGIFARRLNVGIAYHSRHIESAAASYQQSPERESSSKPAFLSSATGKQWLADMVGEASYWERNLIGTMRFVKALEALSDFTGRQKEQPVFLIKIGPHLSLNNPTMQNMVVLNTRVRAPAKTPAFTY
ncbi:polyketide synthase [Apiospora saccharicola]